MHAGDVVDQHTHTRTVLLHPASETLRHLRQLQQVQQVPRHAPGQLQVQVPGQSVLYFHGTSHPAGSMPAPAPLHAVHALSLHAVPIPVPVVRAAPHQAYSYMRQTMKFPRQPQAAPPGAAPSLDSFAELPGLQQVNAMYLSTLSDAVPVASLVD